MRTSKCQRKARRKGGRSSIAERTYPLCGHAQQSNPRTRDIARATTTRADRYPDEASLPEGDKFFITKPCQWVSRGSTTTSIDSGDVSGPHKSLSWTSHHQRYASQGSELCIGTYALLTG